MSSWFCRSIVTGSVLLMPASALGISPALSQASPEREIERFTCKDIMRQSSTNRDVSIAFLHGYLLGRSGTSKFDVDQLKSQTDAFIDQCLDHPGEKAADVMTRLKAGK